MAAWTRSQMPSRCASGEAAAQLPSVCLQWSSRALLSAAVTWRGWGDPQVAQHPSWRHMRHGVAVVVALLHAPVAAVHGHNQLPYAPSHDWSCAQDLTPVCLHGAYKKGGWLDLHVMAVLKPVSEFIQV